MEKQNSKDYKKKRGGGRMEGKMKTRRKGGRKHFRDTKKGLCERERNDGRS